MRIIGLALTAATLVLLFTGCAGPERKLGRGLNNLTEITRGGELHRAMEQTALWEEPSRAYTVGFVRGFNRTMARTGLGLYEVLTFPFPSYDPKWTPEHPLYPDASVQTVNTIKQPNWGGLRLSENPVYPASYKPGLKAASIFETDSTLGFSGGDAAPGIMNSRFKIFER